MRDEPYRPSFEFILIKSRISMDSQKPDPQNPGESGERPHIAATGSVSRALSAHEVLILILSPTEE